MVHRRWENNDHALISHEKECNNSSSSSMLLLVLGRILIAS